MTANIDIVTEEKNNVVVIPQRAVYIDEEGDRSVKVLEKNNSIKEIKIKIGLMSSDGSVEVEEGLQVGDKLLIN